MVGLARQRSGRCQQPRPLVVMANDEINPHPVQIHLQKRHKFCLFAFGVWSSGGRSGHHAGPAVAQDKTGNLNRLQNPLIAFASRLRAWQTISLVHLAYLA